MNRVEFIQHLAHLLYPIYGEREAKLIATYFCEDLDLQDKNIDLSIHETNIQRLLRSEPLQYVTGIAHFYGYTYNVDSSVLIPRPETEELVYKALQYIRQYKLTSVLDIGTGSGCIINTLHHELKDDNIKLYASDVSGEALSIAKRNGVSNITYLWNDILDETHWDNLPHTELIISNPPYISSNEKEQMKENVLNHEPHLALFSESDPLLFYRKIAAFSRYNHQCKYILIEINEHLPNETKAIFDNNGYQTSLYKDLQGKYRIIEAIKK